MFFYTFSDSTTRPVAGELSAQSKAKKVPHAMHHSFLMTFSPRLWWNLEGGWKSRNELKAWRFSLCTIEWKIFSPPLLQMSIKERNESTQKQIELDRYNLEGEMKTNIVYQNIFFLSPLSR